MATQKPLSEWTYSEAAAAATGDLVKDYEVVRRMIEDHDMWLDGAGWLGHRTGDAVVDSTIRANVKPQFVADDVVGEMVENRSNGLLEQEADVALVPRKPSTEAADPKNDPTVAALETFSSWWDSKHFWDAVGQAVDRVSSYRRGDLRAYVAEGNLVNGKLPTGKSLAEAFDLIEIDAPAPTHAVIVKDQKTQRRAAVVLTGEGETKRAEIWTVDPTTKKTTVRTVGESNAGAQALELDLGGRLPLGEARGPRIVTEPVRQMQYLLNFITTMAGRTVETAGNRERYFKNAEPHVMWLQQKPSGVPIIKTDTSTGVTLYGVAAPPILGAGIATFLKGLATSEPTASGAERETIASPDVTSLDPVDPAFATNAAEKVKAALYKRGKQGHLANTSTAEASGLAYSQARAQFAADLKRVKGPVEGMIRDVLECALALAALMSEDAKSLADAFRFSVTLHITAGPITPDESRLAVELRNAGAISRQSMMARVGVEDPAAEDAAIEEEPEALAERWTKIATAIGTLNRETGGVVTLEGAAFLMGLSEKQIEVFRTGAPPVSDAAPAKPVLAA